MIIIEVDSVEKHFSSRSSYYIGRYPGFITYMHKYKTYSFFNFQRRNYKR